MSESPAPKVNGAPLPPNQAFMGLVNQCRPHIAVLVNGLSVSMAPYPRDLQVAAMAAAMGEVMSEATATPKPVDTIALRNKIKDLFKQALRERVPAVARIDPVQMPGFSTKPGT